MQTSESLSKVYIKIDQENRITRCEGGYTTPADLTEWMQIDEGAGDRHNLCQSHYFAGGLYTKDGIPRYKLEDGAPVLRSEEEIAEDRVPDLDAEKVRRIQQSNDDLEDYLLAHPIQWTDGEYYAITQKKQNQLTSKISVAQAKAQLGVPYELKWNTTGEVCVEWELADLMALAFAIDERVTKLVEYQQAKEIEIKNAATIEELNEIEVDYDTVE